MTMLPAISLEVHSGNSITSVQLPSLECVPDCGSAGKCGGEDDGCGGACDGACAVCDPSKPAIVVEIR